MVLRRLKSLAPACALALSSQLLLGATSFSDNFTARILSAHNRERLALGVLQAEAHTQGQLDFGELAIEQKPHRTDVGDQQALASGGLARYRLSEVDPDDAQLAQQRVAQALACSRVGQLQLQLLIDPRHLGRLAQVKAAAGQDRAQRQDRDTQQKQPAAHGAALEQ